jgi:hypothetical protein
MPRHVPRPSRQRHPRASRLASRARAAACEQARGQIDQLAAALLDALRDTQSGSSTIASLHAAVLDKAGVDVSSGQIRDALDQLKTERSVTERGGNITLVS